ncbi:Nuak1 [Symbiodinium necroappetens]|uniref:Nuak1 protein n=1 Tax=Symbiodinium necroappetens TaxID=1628268 RepID=A0A812VRW4_9DINO|nr:Nuak1 [Symbiodinium necroappetens]
MWLASVLFLASAIWRGRGARVDSREDAHSDHKEAVTYREAPELLKYRTFNETGMRLLISGADLPLVASSSLVEEDSKAKLLEKLPKEWRSKLEIVKQLGRGAFGKVFLCKVLCESDSDVYVSVKLIQTEVPFSPMKLWIKREVQLLETMQDYSDFCISTIGSPSSVDNKDGTWIMMPFMNGGELRDLVRRCRNTEGCRNFNNRLDWTKVNPQWNTAYILVLFHDIVAGVEALHEQSGMLHADLKLENVMLNCRGDKCYAAVIDLGIACNPQLWMLRKLPLPMPGVCGRSGTPRYLPPEVYKGSAWAMSSPARDVWALGIILYFLMYGGVPPFFHGNPAEVILEYDVRADPNIPGTKEVDELVREMLTSDYTKRPSLAEIRMKLEDLIELEDSPEAMTMLRQSPAERGAAVATPECLQTPDGGN